MEIATPAIASLTELGDALLARRKALAPSRAFLVGVSGIDASGKGWVTERLAAPLRGAGAHVVTVGVDGWLNLPEVRFNREDPGRHFYHHALRLDEFVHDLLCPLQAHRAVDVEADFAEETSRTFESRRYAFRDVDIVIAEGIFLFKAPYWPVYDFRIWVNCSFETALERAVVRCQEGFSPEGTVGAYRDIYVPAQRIHEEFDSPMLHADRVVLNDPRLADRH